MRKLISIAFLLLIWGQVYSQQSDFVIMPQFAVRYQHSRSLYFKFTQQSLFNENATEFWMSGSDGALGIRLNDHITTEFHSRFIQFKSPRNVVESRALFFHTIAYSNKIGEVNFTLRNRIQQLVFVEHFNDQYRSPRWYNRFRLSAAYRFNYYYSLGVNTEVFYPLNHPSRKTVDQIRVGASFEKKFNEHWEVSIGYQLQQQLARVGNNRYFVASFQTVLSL